MLKRGWAPLRGVVQSRDKYIDLPVEELYDLSRDLAAKVDVSTQFPELTTRLRARYAEAPPVRIDRTQAGRVWRDQQAQPPQPRARP